MSQKFLKLSGNTCRFVNWIVSTNTEMMVKVYGCYSPRRFYCIKFQIADFPPLAVQYSMNVHNNEKDGRIILY